jgi:DNA-binding CsgD family transcriptional regulator
MSQSHEIKFSPQELALSKHFNNAGLIYLENKYYLIYSLQNCNDNEAKFVDFTEVTRLKINQKLYVVFELEQSPNISEEELELTDILTAREMEIAILVAFGKQNKHIAKQLKISEWTVSAHLRRIFTKLGVGSRAAMVYRCSSLIHQNL